MPKGNPGLRVTGNLPTELGRAGFHHSFGTKRYRETLQVGSPGEGQATFLPRGAHPAAVEAVMLHLPYIAFKYGFIGTSTA